MISSDEDTMEGTYIFILMMVVTEFQGFHCSHLGRVKRSISDAKEQVVDIHNTMRRTGGASDMEKMVRLSLHHCEIAPLFPVYKYIVKEFDQ